MPVSYHIPICLQPLPSHHLPVALEHLTIDPRLLSLDPVLSDQPALQSDPTLNAGDKGDIDAESMSVGLHWRQLRKFTKGKDAKKPFTDDEEIAARKILIDLMTSEHLSKDIILRILSSNYRKEVEAVRKNRIVLRTEFQKCEVLKDRKVDSICKHLLLGYFSSGNKFKITESMGQHILKKYPDLVEKHSWSELADAIGQDEEFAEDLRQGCSRQERGPDKLRKHFAGNSKEKKEAQEGA
jgi:hypothetical protein